GSGVEKVCDLRRPLSSCRANQAESDDRCIAVLLDTDILCGVGGRGVTGLGRRRGTNILHHVRFVAPAPAGTGVDELVSPETIMDRGVIVRSSREKLVE